MIIWYCNDDLFIYYEISSSHEKSGLVLVSWYLSVGLPMTPVPSHSLILPCTQPITRFVFVFFVFVFVFVFVFAQSHPLYCCLFLNPSKDKILSHFVFWSSYHLHRKLLISPEIRAWHIWCILIKSEWLWVLQVWTKSTSWRLESSKDILINIKWGNSVKQIWLPR